MMFASLSMQVKVDEYLVFTFTLGQGRVIP